MSHDIISIMMRHGAPSLTHRFVAGFLLLRSTFKQIAASGVQKTSHNHSVYAPHPFGCYGLRKLAAGLTPFVRIFSATFFVRWKRCAFPLSRTKNVVNLNVMCNLLEHIWNNKKKKLRI
jgi:hypothetical protein